MGYRVNQDCKVSFNDASYWNLFPRNDWVDSSHSGGNRYVLVRAVALDSDWVQIQRIDGSKVFVPASVVKYVEHDSLVP